VYNSDEALKAGYLRDSKNRNSYPIVSNPISRFVFKDFEIATGDYDLGYLDNPGEIDIRWKSTNEKLGFLKFKNSNYKFAFSKFAKWRVKIKSLLPVLRDAHKVQILKEKELDNLFKLAEKFGYSPNATRYSGPIYSTRLYP